MTVQILRWTKKEVNGNWRKMCRSWARELTVKLKTLITWRPKSLIDPRAWRKYKNKRENPWSQKYWNWRS